MDVYKSGGALAFSCQPSKTAPNAVEVVVLLIVEVRKREGVVLGIPGGLRDAPDLSPHGRILLRSR